MIRNLCINVLASTVFCLWCSTAFADLKRLEAELVRISQTAKGTVGIGIQHIESKRTLLLHGEDTFPMASTYKIPMAVQLMTLVDHGDLDLDALYTVTNEDRKLTHSVISDDILAGSKLTWRNLMQLMLQHSDNVATDIVLRRAGGPQAVARRMQELGLEMRIDRPTWELILDFVGEHEGEQPAISRDEHDARLKRALEADLSDEMVAFEKDPRDQSTPDAMLKLLVGLWNAEYLTRSSADTIVDMMWGTKTGAGRIKGALPAGTRVAHKTGTAGRTTNDAGIMELPDGRGHVAVVIFIKESKIENYVDREPVIAQLSRTIYDYFLFVDANQ